jgi:hypothetical protein
MLAKGKGHCSIFAPLFVMPETSINRRETVDARSATA